MIQDEQPNKYKVLIVESSKTIMTMLFSNINKLSKIYPITAMNAEDCQFLLETQTAEILIAIVDFSLQGTKDGAMIDLVHSYHIPIIALTGDINTEIHQLMQQKQVLDYVSKRQLHEIEYITHLVQRFYTNRQIKVLIVDDSILVLEQLDILLTRYQYQVLKAHDGIEALLILKEHSDISLMITDYHMPNMNGNELIQKVRKKYRREDLSIIAMSLPNQKNLSTSLLKSGANDFISKQFEIEEFYCRVTQMTDMISYIRKIKETAITDELTGLHNRRYFFDVGEKLYDNAKRKHLYLAAAMFDADFFKKVNDTYGHEIGDEVLRALANSLQENLRSSDILARYGGEEFVCLLVINHKDDIKKIFEKIRKNIESLEVNAMGKIVKFTISIGVTTNLNQNLNQMLNAADQALYEAKSTGRNKVCYDQSVEEIN